MYEFQNEYTWGSAVRENRQDEFHQRFDEAVTRVRETLGASYPMIIDGKEVTSDDFFTVRSPADTSIIVAKFPTGNITDAKNAVSAAQNAFRAWSDTDYQTRARIFYECADEFSKKKFFYAATLAFENGKSRLEAMGDIDEAIDFMRFYAYQLEKNEGFCKTTVHPNPDEATMTVMKPFGVWGIIAPFNFPSAIAIGMTTGALITGNTAVLKPASDAPLSSYYFAKTIHKKMPDGAINFVTGPGSTVGGALIQDERVEGIAFTGSQEIGMSAAKRFTEDRFRPFISEMGGKNPVIVTEGADLDAAAQGVARAAFGYGGQKCSACSRVYVQDSIADQFVKRLVAETKKLKIGMPWERETFLGPVINDTAQKKFVESMNVAKKDGKILAGGDKMPDLGSGYFVEPTIVAGLDDHHRLVTEELFLPILCVQEFSDFDESIKKANDTQYGLTAGIFSGDQAQIEKFFDNIQAGVVYANRAASATTAALVSAQPFVGWKNSGSTGKGAGGRNYLQQFLRTQTQTRCR